jgi:hypothetical protein
MGHSSIQITMDRYGHVLSSADEALAVGLDAHAPAAATLATVLDLPRP